MNATEIDRAVEVLRKGGLVAFPTETVYGLGADARNPAAVRRIFAVKGRPAGNPLIVHVADERLAQRCAAHWPEAAARLARRFWPGPLTLVLRKSPEVTAEATAGRDTVGLRAPDHPLALELLRRFSAPIAAPSANRSTRVSPTTAQHVRDELGAEVDLILDGGPCRVGIESTVLDLTRQNPIILRPGGVSAERIAAEVGQVDIFRGAVADTAAAMSPGQHAVHYAPRARALRFEPPERGRVIQWCRENADRVCALLLVGRSEFEDSDAGLLPPQRRPPRQKVLRMPAGPEEYARRLYAALRDLDAAGVEIIWIEMPPDEPEWLAVRDRLTRATRPAREAL